jgi:peroxiredoxin family protein
MTSADHLGKLSLIVQSGDVDKIHYAFATASAALAINIPVTLFFTMTASLALMGEGEAAGWRQMTTADGKSGGRMDADFRARNIGTMEELISACSTLGARFIVCEMGLKACDQNRQDLRPDLDIDIAGLVTFLSDASSDGQIIYF